MIASPMQTADPSTPLRFGRDDVLCTPLRSGRMKTEGSDNMSNSRFLPHSASLRVRNDKQKGKCKGRNNYNCKDKRQLQIPAPFDYAQGAE
jgi:hypothetical protein